MGESHILENKLLILCTHAKDDEEKANLAFVIGVAAQAADTDVRIFLALDATYLVTKGYIDDIHIAGHPPLRELFDLYLSNGGTLFTCLPCVKRRGISEADLIDGAVLVGVAELALSSSGTTCISL